MGNVLPAPVGVFENCKVETPFREITKTPRHRCRNHHEFIFVLLAIQGIDQLG
ncbi:hypothetical protein PSYPI_35965 [Pseudomonas syringae pv. pisi str. 1704B]|uniref:Uncharacterized protein n=1 Tax=Pseudomonas syringae pv. pisi str. 1704B TaxID=629263 RepID=F3GJX1_PSESJ|nr:hypothetical protein PSYPI_35965 [Pseudomonas syringae pv. pisi str. 1704B]